MRNQRDIFFDNLAHALFLIRLTVDLGIPVLSAMAFGEIVEEGKHDDPFFFFRKVVKCRANDSKPYQFPFFECLFGLLLGLVLQALVVVLDDVTEVGFFGIIHRPHPEIDYRERT